MCYYLNQWTKFLNIMSLKNFSNKDYGLLGCNFIANPQLCYRALKF